MASKRKNPFDDKPICETKNEDMGCFEAAFKVCRIVTDQTTVRAEDIMAKIPAQGLLDIKADLSSGKANHTPKLQAISEHLQEWSILSDAEAKIQYAKDKLRKLVASSIWEKGTNSSGHFKIDGVKKYINEIIEA
jgi:hypothetical protein